MKKYLFFAILSIVVIGTSCSSSSQVKSEKEVAVSKQVTEKVQNKDYQIDASFARPMTGKNISLSPGYNLIIRNDSAFAYLPYYGVAYSAPYGGDGGIKFEQPMKDYQAVPQKNAGEWRITFKTDTPDYNYDVTIDIYSNGKAYLNFNSNQRQSISFDGEMKL